MNRITASVAVLLIGLVAVIRPVCAATYTYTAMEDCPGSKAGTTIATGINDSGEVCGYASASSSGYHFGFIRHAEDAWTTFVGPGGSIAAEATGINNNGDVVGFYYNGDNSFNHAFVRKAADGSFSTFDFNSGPESDEIPNGYFVGINDSGQIAGTITDKIGTGIHGFIRDANGSMTTFDYPSAKDTFAEGISNYGEVTGHYLDAAGSYHYGYVRDAAGDLTSFAAEFHDPFWGDYTAPSYGHGINDAGQAAGTACSAIGPQGCDGFVRSADGTTYDRIDYPDPSNPPTFVLGINQSGEVVGYAVMGGSNFYPVVSFIATPSSPAPLIDKPTAKSVTASTAILGATIEANAGQTITAAGIAYGKSPNPETSGTKKSTPKRSGAFTVQVTGLTSNTGYYFCGYATNKAGLTGNTSDMQLTTLPAAPGATNPSNFGAAGFTANWTPPPGPATINSYQLDVATNTGFSSFVTDYKNLAVSGASTSAQVTGLTLGKTYYYRVRAVNDGGTSANSKSVKIAFEGPLTITLTSPSSGEKFSGGEPCLISWNYTGSHEPLNIDLLLDGQKASGIKSNEPVGAGGKGVYSWTIPAAQAAGSTYQIQISDTSGAILATSANLEIDAPTISVTSPAAGTKFAPGAKCPISWTYTGNPGNVEIELHQNNSTALVIKSAVSDGSKGKGSYAWTIPKTQTQGSGYTVKVTSTASSSIFGASGAFSITK